MKGGKRAGAGNPGYKKQFDIVKNFNKFQKEWWNIIGRFFKSKNVADQKFAITEVNKIQIKLIPLDITSGGKELTQLTKEDVVARVGNLSKISQGIDVVGKL